MSASDWGAKVTVKGKGITSTDPADYVLWSKYPNFLTYIVGTTSFSRNTEAETQTSATILTVTHNLGYKPVNVFFWNRGGNSGSDSWGASQGTPHLTQEWVVPNVTTTQYTLTYAYSVSVGGDGVTGIAPISWTFKYYIMIERGL